MANFGENNFGTPLGALTPSDFFDSQGKGKYEYSGFSSRDGRTAYGPSGFSNFCGPTGVAFLPWKPVLTFPINFAILSGIVYIDWQASIPLDLCDEPATFEIQFTRTLSRNTGWRTLASGIPSSTRTFAFDVSQVPFTIDGGIRIRSRNDRGLVSAYSQSSTAFTVANHAPNPVALTSPSAGDVVDATIAVSWREASIRDIDGQKVTYRIEATDNASSGTGWIPIPGAGAIPEGTTSFLIDSSLFPDGSDYGMRMIATDSLGADSTPSSALGFQVLHSGEFFIDTLPPEGTVLINDGSALAKSQRVKLTLTASDNGTGIRDVRFKNADEDCWSDFDTFASEKTWDLSPADGVKRILVQFRDYAGNISQACDCEIVSRVLCGAGNVTDIEVFSGRLFAAFDRNGNLLEYKVLVSTAATLPEPEITALARLGNSLFIATHDALSGLAKVYRLDGVPTLLFTFSGKILSMVAYNGFVYAGMDNGAILALTSTSSSTSHTATSAVTRLRTDGTVLLAAILEGGAYLSFDGTTWSTNSI